MIIINIIKIILQYAAAACLRCYATNRTEVSDHIIICAVLAFILAFGIQGKGQRGIYAPLSPPPFQIKVAFLNINII